MEIFLIGLNAISVAVSALPGFIVSKQFETSINPGSADAARLVKEIPITHLSLAPKYYFKGTVFLSSSTLC